MVLELSADQSYALGVTQRVISVTSILGVFFIVFTFTFCKGFDKPINRLIFYASWSNLGTNLAGLISVQGPFAGQNSSLCQAQGFMIQMFQGVDAFWALCMAFNVYLSLFHGWTARRLQALDWKYLLACYGLSFIPALVYLFVDSDGRGKVYGPAILWCWISPQWAVLRIATLYGIVWFAIFCASCIYCAALLKARRSRFALGKFLNPLNEDPFGGIITTEITVVHSTAANVEGQPFNGRRESLNGEARLYTVDVNVEPRKDEDRQLRNRIIHVPTITRNAALSQSNADAWLYARVAFLFFLVMVICWIPPTVNRLYSLVQPDQLVFGLNYTASLFLLLQGLLNCLIYMISSQTAVKNLVRTLSNRQPEPRRNVYLEDNEFSPLRGSTWKGSETKNTVDSGIREEWSAADVAYPQRSWRR